MAVEARKLSTRVDNTHMNDGKPAFEAILEDIVSAKKIEGTSHEIRELFQKIKKEAGSHGWFKSTLYLRARAKLLASHRLLKRTRPLPSNIAECIC